MKKFLVSLLAVFLLSPTASAVTLMTGENLVVSDNHVDDLYLLAGNGTIESDVFGDVYIAGGSIVVNGDVAEDLVVAGGKVTIMGDVAGDIRLIGGQLAVYGNVGDDVVVGGGQVDIGKSSIVGGSVLAAAGILTVDGQVKEDVRGLLGMFFLNGRVGGSVIVTIEDTINFSENSGIEGNLEYSALLETKIPDGVVKGKISFNKFERESVLEELNRLYYWQKSLSFLSSLVLLLLFVAFMPTILVKSANITKSYVLRSFGVGLLAVIAGLIGSILLTFTVLGIPLALITFAVIVILMYISKVFVAAWIASYFFEYKKKKKFLSKLRYFIVMTVVLLGYYLLGIIPYVGWLINIILFLIGVGSIVQVKIEYLRFLKKQKMI